MDEVHVLSERVLLCNAFHATLFSGYKFIIFFLLDCVPKIFYATTYSSACHALLRAISL